MLFRSYFATYYWADGSKLVAGRNSPWTVASGDTLTPETPVTLRYEGDGVTIERTVTLDNDYMFTFTDKVTNTSAAPRSLRAVGSIERYGDYKGFMEATDPGSSSSAAAHTGLMGETDGSLRLKKYKPLYQMKKIKGEADDGTFTTEGVEHVVEHLLV